MFKIRQVFTEGKRRRRFRREQWARCVRALERLREMQISKSASEAEKGSVFNNKVIECGADKCRNFLVWQLNYKTHLNQNHSGLSEEAVKKLLGEPQEARPLWQGRLDSLKPITIFGVDTEVRKVIFHRGRLESSVFEGRTLETKCIDSMICQSGKHITNLITKCKPSIGGAQLLAVGEIKLTQSVRISNAPFSEVNGLYVQKSELQKEFVKETCKLPKPTIYKEYPFWDLHFCQDDTGKLKKAYYSKGYSTALTMSWYKDRTFVDAPDTDGYCQRLNERTHVPHTKAECRAKYDDGDEDHHPTKWYTDVLVGKVIYEWPGEWEPKVET